MCISRREQEQTNLAGSKTVDNDQNMRQQCLLRQIRPRTSRPRGVAALWSGARQPTQFYQIPSTLLSRTNPPPNHYHYASVDSAKRKNVHTNDIYTSLYTRPPTGHHCGWYVRTSQLGYPEEWKPNHHRRQVTNMPGRFATNCLFKPAIPSKFAFFPASFRQLGSRGSE